jgi:hypothetical protein
MRRGLARREWFDRLFSSTMSGTDHSPGAYSATCRKHEPGLRPMISAWLYHSGNRTGDAVAGAGHIGNARRSAKLAGDYDQNMAVEPTDEAVLRHVRVRSAGKVGRTHCG